MLLENVDIVVDRTSQKYVVSLDVGTTTIRAFVYDQNGQIRGRDLDKVHLLSPRPGWFEIDPEVLWDTVVKVVRNAIQDAGLRASDVTSMGISTQRGTFVTWSKTTGKPFHNFITWKDLRADDLCKEWDSSYTMRLIRFASKVLHTVTRQKKYMIGSILRLQNKLVTLRLVWALQNVSALKGALAKDDVLFGTVETWILHKLTAGRLHLTDISNAAATGLYDPFSLDYASWAFSMLRIPTGIMPEVVDCAGNHFTSTEVEIFGAPITISACMADQSASVYGLGCFKPGDMKMTLGSGSFLDVNTGADIHASMKGIVPLVGWRLGGELVYLAEGADHDTSSLIQWAQQMKCFDSPSESSELANSITDTNGLFFVPAFCGLQAPVNDPTAAAGLIGLTPQTGSLEILRAVLESISFSMKQLVETMENESDYAHASTIQIDGGVSRNDFIVQHIADLTGKTLERRTSSEMSAFGIAFLAGLYSGVWKSTDDMAKLKQIDRTFKPHPDLRAKSLEEYRQWVKACHRFKNWNVE